MTVKMKKKVMRPATHYCATKTTGELTDREIWACILGRQEREGLCVYNSSPPWNDFHRSDVCGLVCRPLIF